MAKISEIKARKKLTIIHYLLSIIHPTLHPSIIHFIHHNPLSGYYTLSEKKNSLIFILDFLGEGPVPLKPFGFEGNTNWKYMMLLSMQSIVE